MKIKVVNKRYEDVIALPKLKYRKPLKNSMPFRILLKILSLPDIWGTGFECNKIGMEKLGKKEPCLFLMNHSCFLDMKIASTILFPRPFNVVSTLDGFVGKAWLMRLIGCIPTIKFVSDTRLVRDMTYAVKELKSSVLMYPEACYSFDGTATALPESLGRCIKMLGVPVVVITTHGAFARDPLYNGLRHRKVKVTADMKYVLSPHEIAEKSPEELFEIIQKHFEFDNFRWQQENEVHIPEKFRAEGLNRVLYKCPKCGVEGKMVGKNTLVTCHACGKQYELTELGYMKALEGETEFDHIPDWYKWERDCVREEILNGTYKLEVPVDICMLVNTKCLYSVGEGVLTHTSEGFTLKGCDGKLEYKQRPSSSYSLNADYFWYEIGDIICVGDIHKSYYCFPKIEEDIVAKTRLATEELYKLARENKKNSLKKVEEV